MLNVDVQGHHTPVYKHVMKASSGLQLGDLHLNPTVYETYDETAPCKQCGTAAMLAVPDILGRPYRAIPCGSRSLTS